MAQQLLPQVVTNRDSHGFPSPGGLDPGECARLHGIHEGSLRFLRMAMPWRFDGARPLKRPTHCFGRRIAIKDAWTSAVGATALIHPDTTLSVTHIWHRLQKPATDQA